MLRWMLPLALAFSAHGASGQAVDARAAALGGSLPAGARGAAAVRSNPALLGTPGWAFQLPSFTGGATAGPVGMRSFFFGDADVPLDVRAGWFDAIRDDGGQWARGNAGLTSFAAARGAFGIALSTTVSGDTWLPVDAARLGLFGNGSGPGKSSQYSLAGTRAQVRSHSSITAAWGTAVTARLRLGVSGSMHVGHFLLAATDNGSVMMDRPRWISVDLPAIHAGAMSPGSRAGSGYSLSTGAAWTHGSLSLALVLHDFAGSFEWDRAAVEYQPVSLLLSDEDRSTGFDARPLTEAPEEVQHWAGDILERDVASFRIEAGAGLVLRPATRLHGSLHYSAAESRAGGGLGLEHEATASLTARAGLASARDGASATVGGGYRYRRLRLDTAFGAVRLAGSWGSVFALSASIVPTP